MLLETAAASIDEKLRHFATEQEFFEVDIDKAFYTEILEDYQHYIKIVRRHAMYRLVHARRCKN